MGLLSFGVLQISCILIMLTTRELLWVYFPKDSTCIIDDPLLESVTHILIASTTIPYMINNDIINELTKFNTHTYWYPCLYGEH